MSSSTRLAHTDALAIARQHAEAGRFADFLDLCRQVTELHPDDLSAQLDIGALLSAYGFLTAARTCYERALSLELNDLRATINLANLARDAGEYGEARRLYADLLARLPDQPVIRRNALTSLEYDPEVTDTERFTQDQAWGEWAFTQAGGPQSRPPLRALGGRPLRLGYVSADLCQHTVGLFVKDVLKTHDGSQVQVFAYSAGQLRDWVTEEIRTACQFRDIGAMNDGQLAQQIRQDQIDILIDLSGHTAGSRLTAFAHRPAPVMVSWLGYFATTGLSYIDAVLLDKWHAPPGTEAQFVEPIIRLPQRLCYTPVPFAPAVSPVPTFTKGHITFGSFNNTAKYNPQVFDLWAQILARVPDSRLILKWRSFNDEALKHSVRAAFADHGIHADRIELRGPSFHADLLKEYADLDIALDPFPFTGGLTSCEALWMGVPVVTWPQGRVVSRQTFAFLNQIGLPELAAKDAEDYVRIAVELANNKARLQNLHKTLRQRMEDSPLCDVTGFTRSLENAYFNLYREIAAKETESRANVANSSPNHKAEALHQTGLHHLKASQLAEAETCLQQALTLAPDNPNYLAHLAVVQGYAGKLSAAETNLQTLINHNQVDRSVKQNLAVIIANQGRMVEALEIYRVLLNDPNPDPGLELNAAYALLKAGLWVEGWQKHELRYHPQLQDKLAILPSGIDLPLWQGEPLTGKSILVVGEQGLGDQIMFVRYLPVLKQVGAKRVDAFVSLPLIEAIAAAGLAEHVYGQSGRVKETYDYYVFIGSLPLRLGMPEPVAGWSGAYLKPRVVSPISELPIVDAPDGKLKVGVVWSGNLSNRDARFASKYRFFEPTVLTPLFDNPQLQCYSLQHGETEQALTHPRVIKLGNQIGSMQDTVDLVARMDVIVTVDTSIAHVAGALGKPVHLLLPYSTDWRWGVESDRTDWYPSARLYRSRQMNDWGDLVQQVLQQLSPRTASQETRMCPKTILHVGPGHRNSGARLPQAFQTPVWQECRLDIDPANEPDILGSMLDMAAVQDNSVDAIYSSHNIEHVHAHEVPIVLREFLRVLKPDGFLVVTCPDLQTVCQLVAEDKLGDPAYTSQAGPITPLDILYGHGQALAAGHHYMAHKCGFTLKTLTQVLHENGFASSAGKRRARGLDLWVVATKGPMEEGALRELAGRVLPA